MKHPSTGGSIIFQIRRCTPDILDVRKQKRKAAELEKLKQLQQEQQQKQKMQEQQKKFQSQPNLQQQQQLQQNIHQQTLHQQMINNNNNNNNILKTSASTLQPSSRGNANNFPVKSNPNLYQIDGIDSSNININNNIHSNATITTTNTNNTNTNSNESGSKLPFPLLVELNHGKFRFLMVKLDLNLLNYKFEHRNVCNFYSTAHHFWSISKNVLVTITVPLLG